MQDLFNEWHAKNTSEKVRRVMQNKGMAGIPLTTNPPFGYMKNPDNKKEWIVDEPAAEIVRRIFDMCISGFGPAQIATKQIEELDLNHQKDLKRYPSPWKMNRKN